MANFTEAEYAKLLDWVNGEFKTPFPEVNKATAQGWKNVIKRQLEGTKINWTHEARKVNLQRLRVILKSKFEKRLVENGFPAGINAGVSFGENSTQFTLKLKGNVGTGATGKITNLMTSFSSLINSSENPTNQRIEIRFIKNYTYNTLYLSRRLYQSLKLSNEGFILRTDVLTSDELSDNDWYPLYEKFYGALPDNLDIGFRIQIDPQLLFNFQLTLDEIVDRIEEKDWLLVMSPQNIGIIDVYFIGKILPPSQGQEEPEEDYYVSSLLEIKKVDETMQKTFYLRTEVLPTFFELEFGAISQVPEVFVNWDPFSAAILSEQAVGNGIRIIWNEKVIREKGFSKDRILKFLTKKGWKDKNGILTNENGKKSVVSHMNEALENPTDFNDVVKPFLEANSGFDQLIISPEVDTSRSFTDAMKPMKRKFGIEASRRTFIIEMGDMLRNDHYVSPVHIFLVADFMTSTGEVVALNRFGQGRAKEGPISQGTFEEPLPGFMKAIAFPKAEGINISTALFTGERIPLGVGVVDVQVDPIYAEYWKRTKEKPTIQETAEGEEIEDLVDIGDAKATNIIFEMPKSQPVPAVVSIPLPKAQKPVKPTISRATEGSTGSSSSSFTVPRSNIVPRSFSVAGSAETTTPLQQPPIGTAGRNPKPMIPLVSPYQFLTVNRKSEALGKTDVRLQTDTVAPNVAGTIFKRVVAERPSAPR